MVKNKEYYGFELLKADALDEASGDVQIGNIVVFKDVNSFDKWLSKNNDNSCLRHEVTKEYLSSLLIGFTEDKLNTHFKLIGTDQTWKEFFTE